MTKTLTKTLTLVNLSPVSILSFLPWVALLSWLSSLAWFLCDDAFISFRYVRNFLEGNGLVFNPGEYVEGYTNFLWILETGRYLGNFRRAPGVRRPLVIGNLHHRYDRRHVVVDPPFTLSARPGSGRMDGAGAALHQCHLRCLDLRRRAGNPTVHLFHCYSHSLSYPVRNRAPWSAGRLTVPRRCRIDPTGGIDAGGLLLHPGSLSSV